MDTLIPLDVAAVLFVLGLSYLLQTDLWIKFMRRSTANPELLFPLAMVLIAAGVIVGYGYNNWNGTWPIFVTALGWLMALKGAVILLLPKLIQRYERLSDKFFRIYLRFGGALLMVLAVLLYRANTS
jgi:uncharacterized protein YjeT (DUF2065 family)